MDDVKLCNPAVHPTDQLAGRELILRMALVGQTNGSSFGWGLVLDASEGVNKQQGNH